MGVVPWDESDLVMEETPTSPGNLPLYKKSEQEKKKENPLVLSTRKNKKEK